MRKKIKYRRIIKDDNIIHRTGYYLTYLFGVFVGTIAGSWEGLFFSALIMAILWIAGHFADREVYWEKMK